MDNSGNGVLSAAAKYREFVEQIKALTEYDPEVYRALLIDIASDPLLSKSDANKLLIEFKNNKSLKLKMADLQSDYNDISKGVSPRSNSKPTAQAVQGGEIPLTVSQSSVADWILAQGIEQELCFDPAWGLFMTCMNGCWQQIDNSMAFYLVREKVKSFIQENPDAGVGYNSGFVQGVITFLRGDLTQTKFNYMTGMIPLLDGVYHIDKQELKDHDPKWHFTWQLPFPYDKDADCPEIKKWLAQASSDRKKQPDAGKVELIRAFIRAAMTADMVRYQKFLEIYGDPGTGKGTLMRLIEALIGKSNIAAPTLSDLETYRHTTAVIKDKRLISIDDADSVKGGILAMLKRLTGGGSIPFSPKNINPLGDFATFVYAGALLLSTNTRISTFDGALLRRRIAIEFYHIPDKVEDLDRKFRDEIPGFFNWVLELSEESAIETLNRYSRIEDMSSAVQDEMKDSILEGDILARWLHANTRMFEAGGKVGEAVDMEGVKVGIKKEAKTETGIPYYEGAEEELLPNFLTWAAAHNEPHKISHINFRKHLMRLSRLLKLPIRDDVVTKGAIVYGLRLTQDGTGIKSPIAYRFNSNHPTIEPTPPDNPGKIVTDF